MRNEDFLDQVGVLLDAQRVGVLATNYRNTPHQSLIAYTHAESLREIYFITPRYTRKVEAMAADPRVAFIVDNRQNVESDFDACIAVTAKGTVEEIPRQPQPAFIARYLKKHPYLEEFATAPTCSYFRIRVRSYTLVSSFQRVEELILE
ncbi:MAG: pyridoxamine 5'-phosphate oxidase family protein [Spirochaetales bacterium]|nr:pyridoxamine 5'-phosphate oxidase family protein [Spirochaetales bacterium]